MKTPTLWRKVYRDAARNLGQVAAVAAVIGAGVATFVTMRTSFRALERSRTVYYRDYRFADVFAGVRRAPETLRTRIERISGVAEVETRLVYALTLDVPGLAEPATGRLISAVPEQKLNRIFLRAGRMPLPESRDEVVVSEAFAARNAIAPGSTIGAVLNGRWVRLRVTGIGISPEYVYELQGAGFFPDRRFGVMWMPRDAMEAAFAMTGAFNDVSVRLAPGASEGEVIRRLDALLTRYGSPGAYGRKDQLSNRFVSDEINGDRVSSTVVPPIFLAIAAFLTYVVLARLVARQRDSIATLKAFGYANGPIVEHYVLFALIPAAVGATVGIGAGIWAGHQLGRVYAEFFRFPVFAYRADGDVMAIAVLAAAIPSAVGAWLAVGSVARMQPAEAMRPASPAAYRAGWVEQVSRLLPVTARFALRNMSRHPVKVAATVAGIGVSIAILMIGRYFFDSLEYVKYVEFAVVERQTATVAFNEVREPGVESSLHALPGVLRVEPFRTVAVRLRAGHRDYRTAIQSLPARPRMHRLIDLHLRVVPLPYEGMVMSATLARILSVRPGDRVTVEVLEGRRRETAVRVAGLVDELIGANVYMEIGALGRLVGDARGYSGARMEADPVLESHLYARLKQLPAVAGVNVREAMLKSFDETVAESLQISVGVFSIFAGVIAFSIVYNSVRIALSERSHELASLRVLGFTRWEVAAILLGEHMFLSVCAIPAGLLMGRALCEVLSRSLETELYRLPVVLSGESYVYALGMVILASIFSALLVGRGIWRLDLIAALKTRE
ncbi:MAG: ABC transporter permease [Bryobacteraceae bacterium]